MADGFRRFSAEHGLSDTAVWPFLVALDEVISNTVAHGFGEAAGAGRIEVEFDLRDGVMAVHVLDDAPPFNPLEVPPPDLTAPLEDRPVGGLGIHILRELMDNVAYRRADGRNQLTFARRVS